MELYWTTSTHSALASVNSCNATYIGDNFDADVRGSWAAGLRSVWVNRTGLKDPEAEELRAKHLLA